MTVKEFLNLMEFRKSTEANTIVHYEDVKYDILVNVYFPEGLPIVEGLTIEEYFQGKGENSFYKNYHDYEILSFDFEYYKTDGAIILTLCVENPPKEDFKWLVDFEDLTAVFDTKEQAIKYFENKVKMLNAKIIFTSEGLDGFMLYKVEPCHKEWVDDVTIRQIKCNPINN